MFWVDAELGSDVYLDGEIIVILLPVCKRTGDGNILSLFAWLISSAIASLTGDTCRGEKTHFGAGI